MQLFDSEYSRHSLQRWVALVTGTAALIITTINIGGTVLLYHVLPIQTDRNTLLPIGLAVLLFLSGAADSEIARALQVIAFALVGLVLTIVVAAEQSMTSAVFVIFALVLCYEYRTDGLPSVWSSGVIGLAYAVALTYSLARAAEAVP